MQTMTDFTHRELCIPLFSTWAAISADSDTGGGDLCPVLSLYLLDDLVHRGISDLSIVLFFNLFHSLRCYNKTLLRAVLSIRVLCARREMRSLLLLSLQCFYGFVCAQGERGALYIYYVLYL